MKNITDDLSQMMDNQLEFLAKNFRGIRVGRASADFVAPVIVEAYGQKLPINQVATISVMDERTLSVDVWDKSVVNHVERAINAANLGLATSSSSQSIILSMPMVTSESRDKLVKLAGKYAEEAKVAMRNNRRIGMDNLKALKKSISEDEFHSMSEKIQELTDEYIKKIDNLLSAKEKDILKV